MIGSILGLTQFRIKRLFAYSTISHIGFILLALSMNTIESIQAFFFYIMQYSISNLNAFIILLAIGYSFGGSLKYNLRGSDEKEKLQASKDSTDRESKIEQDNVESGKNIQDKNLSPVQ